MNTQLARSDFGIRKTLGLSVLSFTILLMLSVLTARAASLTGTTYDLRLLGHVQNLPTSPTMFSTQGYEASAVFNPIATPVPSTIAASPVPPFNAGNVLRVDESEVTLPDGSGRGMLWIRGPATNPSHTFTNLLNPNMPVELDLTLRFNGVPDGFHVAITQVRAENGSMGFYDPEWWQFSGIGTAADPLLLEIRLDPNNIQREGLLTSHVKVQFDWVVIPEPATLALLGIGFAAILGLVRRRR